MTVKFSGKALTIGIPNPNGHIYPTKMIKKEVKRLNPIIKDRALLGELRTVGSYKNDSEEDMAIIHIANVSHVVTAAKINDDALVIEVDCLDTPAGLELQKALHSPDFKKYYSMNARGIGELDDKNNVTSYKLIAIDVVSTKPDIKSSFTDEEGAVVEIKGVLNG
jgi:hypothetical protein